MTKGNSGKDDACDQCRNRADLGFSRNCPSLAPIHDLRAPGWVLDDLALPFFIAARKAEGSKQEEGNGRHNRQNRADCAKRGADDPAREVEASQAPLSRCGQSGRVLLHKRNHIGNALCTVAGKLILKVKGCERPHHIHLGDFLGRLVLNR